jgi:hypothetical protein
MKINKTKNTTQYVYDNTISMESWTGTKHTCFFITSKKDRQRNGQKKKDKRTNNDLQNIDIKLKIE